MDTDLRARAELAGIATRYRDAAGRWRSPPDATLTAILAAMRSTPGAAGAAGGGARVEGGGVPGGSGAGGWPPVLVLRRRRAGPWRPPPGERVRVVFEAGGALDVPAHGWTAALGAGGELPLGYHTVIGATGQARLVIVPERCFLPPDADIAQRRYRGWAVQLYALRSRRDWGIGDLGDLAELAGSGAARDFLLVNPLHAAPPTEPSPYFPGSRLARNPLYLEVEALPEVAELGPAARERLSALAAAGRRLDRDGLVDRPAAFAVKDAALRLCHEHFLQVPGARGALERWRWGRPELDGYAVFTALERALLPDWRRWPASWRSPGAPGVAARRSDPEAVYQAWLQWRLDGQLAALPKLPLGLVGDLAVGFAAGGFDAWWFQDAVAQGVTIGAPADQFSPRGQDWGVAPFDPAALRAAGYEPFSATLRESLRRLAGLRIDHAMGLSRLFWVPDGAPADEGTYVRYPAADLLGILALESHRAGALVIGEDLGTVEPAVRRRLGTGGLLSTRVLWFEREGSRLLPPDRYPRLALTVPSTHDLPTVGEVLADGNPDQERLRSELLAALRAAGLLGPGAADARAVSAAVRAFLDRTPSLLLALSLEDALGLTERPNVPGTSSPTNWSRRLPLDLGEVIARLRGLAGTQPPPPRRGP